jgi:hypothetical protein
MRRHGHARHFHGHGLLPQLARRLVISQRRDRRAQNAQHGYAENSHHAPLLRMCRG